MEVERQPESDSGTAVRTFLFVDIRGYTRFLVEHGDAAGARMLERFSAVARRCVTDRNGKIFGQAGDEEVAVFGSARDALRAAVDLQAGVLKDVQADPSIPLQVGIGLDTGEAIPRGDDYVGTALNLAARLCKLAGPNEILASDGVVHVARRLDGIAYVERGLAQLKGFQEPVRVFQVVEDSGSVKTPGTADRGPEPSGPVPAALPIGAFLGALPSTQLVAREQELARALTAADAVASGSGRFVLLSGEAGVGKTRLAQEIMLTIRNRRFLVATGRCYQPNQPIPFYPFLDALSTILEASPAALRSSVTARWPYLGRLLPELQTTNVPAATTTPEEQQRLFRDSTGFVKEVAREVPLAIMLDDLHWADQASVELLQHLARHTRADRVLLVGTYRDSELGRHHPLDSALRDLFREDLVERIRVGRLEPNGTSRLIAATLGEASVSPELDSVVHQHADGNPFFTQQLVRFFVERGDVYRKNGRWAERSLRRVEVPESVRSVIAQRMDRLKEVTQEILREASVLGQVFSFDLLVRLNERPEPDVDAALEEARATGLIEERKPDTYAFDHSLTQQTLYAELSPRKRRKLHAAAAEGLEALPESERSALSAELAWHFIEAAQEERAVPYAIVAGDRARSLFANREAELQYTTVVEIADQFGNQDRVVDALTRRARLYLDTWRGKAALPDFERLLTIARDRGDRRLELQARLGLAYASYIVALDETEADLASQSRTMYESAYALADELNDPRAKVEALLGTRWFADFWPEYRDQVRKNVAEAIELSRSLGHEDLLLRAELAGWSGGTRAEAEANGERLARKLRERREFHSLNLLYFSMMWAYLEWGEFAHAVEVCDAGIQVANEIGVPPVQYSTLKALALLQLGRYGDAWVALQHEVTDAEHPFGRAMQAMGIATYLLAVGDYRRAEDSATALITEAAKLRRAWLTARGAALRARALLGNGSLAPEDWTQIQHQLELGGELLRLSTRAEVLLSQGDAAGALGSARAAEAQALKEEGAPDVIAAQELQARALLQLGQPSDSAQVAGQALSEARKLGALPLEWRLLNVQSNALRLAHDETGAAAALRESASILRRVAASISDSAEQRRFLSTSPADQILGAAG